MSLLILYYYLATYKTMNYFIFQK